MCRILALLIIFIFPVLVVSQQLIIPLGHSGRVNELAISYDGGRLASVDGNTQVKVWEYTTGMEMYQLKGHRSGVERIAFHPSRQILVSGDKTGTLIFWDEKGQVIRQIKAHESGVQDMAFSTKGDTLFTVHGDSAVYAWDSSTGGKIANTPMPFGGIGTIAVNGDVIAAGSKTGQLTMLNLLTKKNIFTGQPSESGINTLTFTKNQVLAGNDQGELIRMAASGENDPKKIKIFDARLFTIATTAGSEMILVSGRDSESNLQLLNHDLKKSGQEIPLEIPADPLGFRLGIEAATFSPDGRSVLVADYNNQIREWDLTKSTWNERVFRGQASPINEMALNPTGKQLAIASSEGNIKFLDLTGSTHDYAIPGHPGGVQSVDFHPLNPVLVSGGNDDKVLLWNLVSKQPVMELKARGAYKTLPVRFDKAGNYIIRKNSEKDFDLYDFKKSSPKSLRVKDARDFEFSPDGLHLIFRSTDELSMYDPILFKKEQTISTPGVTDFSISKSNILVTLNRDRTTVKMFKEPWEKPYKTLSLPDSLQADRIALSPDGEYLVTYRRTITNAESGGDYSVNVFRSESGELIKKLVGHEGFITSVIFLKDDKFMLTSSVDGTIRIWKTEDFTETATVIPMEAAEWVVTTPLGLFDATNSAMSRLHYVKNGQVIALNQLKNSFYEPELLPKLLGYNQEQIRETGMLNELNMYPEIRLKHPMQNEGRLGLDLSDQGGGIGRIVIFINGKEVSNDVRDIGVVEDDRLEIDYDIEGHPYLLDDQVNKIVVKAYNEDGTLSSREKNIYVFAPSSDEKAAATPKLYAIIAGTSDYSGDHLDLKYAAKDASDFASALRLSAEAYLGIDNIDITLLTTDETEAEKLPTKENIKAAFKKYSQQAKAKDLLVIYLSGHGMNYGGTDGDFYYLTTKSSNGNIDDPKIRNEVAISSTEFTDLIKSVPALKQVMIIDACHSGRLASKLATARDVSMSSSQIRALEKMKDRTGLFILAGSAADAVSYETTLYGQGLLTYSILFGMKGAALRDDEFIDVMGLFQFAATKVPELAADIGGIQKPEIRLPDEGSSFDIGRLDETGKKQIILKEPKPVFVHSQFQEDKGYYDRLGLGARLDEALKTHAAEREARMVFVDDNQFIGAYEVEGRYKVSNGLIQADIKIYRDGEQLHSFRKEAVDPHFLIEAVYEQTLTVLGI